VFEGPDDALSFPKVLIAATVNVYVAPLVSPVTVSVVAVELNRVDGWAVCPIHGVTTYPVSGAGNASGACHDTTALASPATAVPICGGGSATQLVKLTAPKPTTNTHNSERRNPTDRVNHPDTAIPRIAIAPRQQFSELYVNSPLSA
jgi:hypothetical protein